MLIALSDWALKLIAALTPEQMHTMLRSEHGGISALDAGRKFDVLVNGETVASLDLEASPGQEIYTRDVAIPKSIVAVSGGKLVVKFVAKPGSLAGGLYGVRLLRSL
ncbi:DUF6805 domain-containing protein [Massilia rubra]|uniref:Glycoside hydrolase GH146 substrate-binding domain-containing protein n=1 Tax=Massilia rubra TaxID=2607910 RepID=A0ABX0LUF0_9BURK|nr:DUF6805 domain-containing protein [Massilia rubra]NHZ35985.1 hypothetical protein [Massilia rubra]